MGMKGDITKGNNLKSLINTFKPLQNGGKAINFCSDLLSVLSSSRCTARTGKMCTCH
jgi:hypothetical protein